ncbi:MAG: hypothetical protein AB7I30_04860 [Isosphaeraceae bacterium]
MSLITRPRRGTERSASTPTPQPVPTAPAPFRSMAVTEAPDRGLGPTEAPETYRGRPVEAPDAGESRGGHHDHEFKHGRSQS